MTYDSTTARDARIDLGALFGAIVRRLPRIVLVTLLLLAATFVVLMFMPRLYESSASILIEPRSNVYLRASNEQAPQIAGGETGVVSSQIELLKSRDTLLTVIDELDLRSNAEFNGSQSGFSPLGMIMQMMGRSSAPRSIDETVLGTLYDRMTVVQERDSRIISVLVRSTDPQVAADIANAVANAHVARRTQLSLADTANASGWLEEEISRLRVSVNEADSAVAQFKVDNDLFTGTNNTSLLDQQLSTISTQINGAQERKNTALSRAQLIRGLIDRGQPIEGVADVRDSVVIQQLSQEKARLQGEQAQRSATLLSNHPTIRALNAQIAELDNQISLEGQRVAAALDAEAQIEADLEASLQADLARLKSSASTATRDTVTLDGLTREAKAQRDLLEAYLLRYTEASSRVDVNSALPDVRVVSLAAPAVTPASPKTQLILVAVGLVAFAVQIAAVVFGELMSGRAIQPVALRPQDELDATVFDESELEPDQRWEEPAPVEATEAVETVEVIPETVAAEPFLPVPEVPFESAPVEVRATEVQPVEEAHVEPEIMAESSEYRRDESLRSFIRALAAEPEARIADAAEEDLPVETVDDAAENAAAAEMLAATLAQPTPAQPVVTKPARPLATVLRYDDLTADLVLGRTHLLLLADHGRRQASIDLAEELAADALAKGLSVALVDAGSGRRGDLPGLTDLSSGDATFGDVVQKSADNSFAEVVWGQGAALRPNTSRSTVLVEALGDIYEVVIVLTGQVGGRSSLAAFAELDGRVVLVAGDETEVESAEAARAQLTKAGLPRVEIAALIESVAA